MTRLPDVTALLRDIVREAAEAQTEYDDFASMHEAYGVLAEEVEELFECVRMGREVMGMNKDGRMRSRAQGIKAEAIQVAAVALRIAEQAERVTR